MCTANVQCSKRFRTGVRRNRGIRARKPLHSAAETRGYSRFNSFRIEKRNAARESFVRKTRSFDSYFQRHVQLTTHQNAKMSKYVHSTLQSRISDQNVFNFVNCELHFFIFFIFFCRNLIPVIG